MKITRLPYEQTNAFSQLVSDFLSRAPHIEPFLNRFPTLENFEAQIQEKAGNYSFAQRQTLVSVLEKQYQGVEKSAAVDANIAALTKEIAFTITTGHQLNIFTGPLYFIYKIASAIKTCQLLQEKFPAYKFVPVYWMASEDHDFAEINHFNLFGKRYEWHTEQKGAVGHFELTGLESVLAELPEQFPVFEKAYRGINTLAEATRKIVNTLFGEYGLVIIDGDDAELKQSLTPVILDELANQESFKLVKQTNETLSAYYKPQVMARQINLFYLCKGMRERIVLEDGVYKVLNSDLTFSPETIQKLAEENPEHFSPNVILRPLYQEMVLPNLAYFGGGAEVAYWMQLKGVFDHYKVPFPILMLRNSALYINKTNAARLHKLGLKQDDLFAELPTLKKLVSEHLNLPEVSLQGQQNGLAGIFKTVEELATGIDPTLEKAVAAEAQKVHNALMMLEKRLNKAQETKHDTVFKQLTSLKEKLFPDGHLQERSDNLLSILANNPQFISGLIEAFEPLDNTFTILEEEV